MKDPKDKMLPEDIFSHQMILPTPELIEKERNANTNQTYQSGGIDIYKILIGLGLGFCEYKIREMKIEEKEQRMNDRLSRALDIAETLHKRDSARRKEEEARRNKNHKLFIESLKSIM